jgi:SAM-dependent methyltransferase
MESYFKQDIWTDTGNFNWGSRRACAEIIGAIIKDQVDTHIDPTQTTIEIGSGLGALGAFIGNRQPTICIEGSSQAIGVHRITALITEQIVNGDLYNLPFTDNSIPNAIGMLVLDAMTEASVPFAEIARVLSPGGKFVYFHDLRASFNALCTDIRRKGYLPIPLDDHRIAIMGYKDFNKFKKLAKRAWRNGDIYTNAVIEELVNPSDHPDAWYWDPDIQESMTGIIEGSRELKRTICPDMTTLMFAGYLEILAKENNMDIIEIAMHQGDRLVSRHDVLATGFDLEEHENGVLHSAKKGTMTATIPDIPEDKVLTATEVLVFVAQKR